MKIKGEIKIGNSQVIRETKTRPWVIPKPSLGFSWLVFALALFLFFVSANSASAAAKTWTGGGDI